MLKLGRVVEMSKRLLLTLNCAFIAVMIGVCATLLLAIGNPTLSPLPGALLTSASIMGIIGGLTGLISSWFRFSRLVLVTSIFIGIVTGTIITLYISESLHLNMRVNVADGYLFLGLLIALSTTLNLSVAFLLSSKRVQNLHGRLFHRK